MPILIWNAICGLNQPDNCTQNFNEEEEDFEYFEYFDDFF